MTIMNLADYEGDHLVGKRTLTVVFGPQSIVRFHAIVQALAYLLILPAVTYWDMPVSVGVAISLTAPLAAWHSQRVLNAVPGDVATANSVVFWASSQSAIVVDAAYLGLLLRGAGAPGGATLPAVLIVPPVAFLGLLLFQVWLYEVRDAPSAQVAPAG